MNKKWLTFVLVGLLMLASLPNYVAAARPITITLNGKLLPLDIRPVLENDRLLVPLRNIFEALGAKVEYDKRTETITATKGATRITLQTFSTHGFRNGEVISLGVPAKVDRGRTMVPLTFCTKALGAKVEWDAENGMVKIKSESELELAKEQVEKYLTLLDKAVNRFVNDEDWVGVLSQKAINSGYGVGARVFRPVPGAGVASGTSISDVEIIKAKYARETKSNAYIIVTARYIYNNPAELDTSRQRTQYEKEYRLLPENGRLVIDSEHIKALRYFDDIPLVTLTEKDIEKVAKSWQQDNYYSYYEVLDINNNFISPTLSETLGMVYWGNTSTPSGKERFEQLLANFSPNVKDSKGWQDFINLKPRRDPTFTVLWAKSTRNRISAILFGKLFPGFDLIPAILEIEIQKKPAESDADKWLITCIENVRSYNNLFELKKEEPQIYKALVTMDNYYRYTLVNRTNKKM